MEYRINFFKLKIQNWLNKFLFFYPKFKNKYYDWRCRENMSNGYNYKDQKCNLPRAHYQIFKI